MAGLAVFIGLTLLTSYALVRMKRRCTGYTQRADQDLVESSRGTIAYYQQLEADKKLSREEAQQQAKGVLRTPRFGANDYYFLYDFEGRALMVAGNPKMEGEVFLGKTDKKDFKMWDAIVAAGKAGTGYIDYWFPRAGQTEAKPKRGYVIGIPECSNGLLGTGVYVDDVDEAVKREVLSYGAIALTILAVVAIFAFLVSRSIVNQLGGEPAAAIDLMSRAAAGDLTIEVSSAHREAFWIPQARWFVRFAGWLRKSRRARFV